MMSSLHLFHTVAASCAPQVAQNQTGTDGMQITHRSSTCLMGECCLTASCRAVAACWGTWELGMLWASARLCSPDTMPR